MLRFLCLLTLALLLSAAAHLPAGAAKATVYIFLSDTCPICQAATPTLRQLHASFATRGVEFVGVFPEEQLRPADLVLFQKHYPLPFPLRLDQRQQLVRRFGARITPEVVVTAPDGRVLYQGRIDDSYARLGQRRTVVQHHELRDALTAVLAGQPVAQPRTEAVGCYINL
ncbi:redoxin domain-containing protein [Hymenobacter weizhouensis]|uniref:redoxin domain-containing protein n=1 Tax=Hymenobacter sp. YIM 151500-1 TaxID=2987689 RepID=UPI00222725CB|nr:redoxin domain-containing protein [Hymenobacter sp. YIM 151500-1]UYZ61391.1 redoxin domain-containing protein [Hymenobacter sp. YIM 151500-1]